MSWAKLGDGRWEGWIEFVPLDRGVPIRSGRETTQPNHDDTVYWANGLTPIYLEGALERALKPLVVTTAPRAHAVFDSPAPAMRKTEAPVAGRAILDPFSVYEKSEALLRQELGALSAWHLVNIATAYRLSDQPPAVVNQLSRPALIELIVRGVREHVPIR